jgi:hypothetical protein
MLVKYFAEKALLLIVPKKDSGRKNYAHVARHVSGTTVPAATLWRTVQKSM